MNDHNISVGDVFVSWTGTRYTITEIKPNGYVNATHPSGASTRKTTLWVDTLFNRGWAKEARH